MLLPLLMNVGMFTGGAPQPEVAPSLAAGSGGRKRRERWSLMVDGRAYVFETLDALIAFLDTREETKVEEVKAQAEQDAQRVIKIGQAKAKPKPPKVRIESPVAEIKEYVDAVQAKIDRLYWRALADALAREAEEDEDIAFIATLQ